MLWLAWRHRRPLRPLAGLVVLAVAASVGHVAGPSLVWVPLALGLGIAVWLALNGYRPIHAWYAVGSLAAGAWAAGCWWLGPLNPAVAAGLPLLVAGGAGVWLAHRPPRPRVRIIGGSSWPWQWQAWRFRTRHRARLKRVIAEWPVTAHSAKVAGAKALLAIADAAEPNYRLKVELRGLTSDDLRRNVRRVATGLRARRMSALVEDDEHYEHLAWVVWAREDADVESADQPDRDAPVPLFRDPPAVTERQADEEHEAALGQLAAALDGQPRPGREIAEDAGLEYEWTWRHGLPSLLERGLAEKTQKGWKAKERR